MVKTHALSTPPNSWRWALAGGLLGLLLTLLLCAPARWLAAGLERASGERVRLSDVRGSVWQGSTQLTLTAGAGSVDGISLPGRLDWQLRPSWTGAVAHVSAHCCMAQPLQIQLAVLGLNRLQLAVSDAVSQWPASLMAGLGTPWNTIQPRGQLQLQTRGVQAQWQGGEVQLQGHIQLDANQMSSRLSTLQPMGSYRFTVQGGQPSTVALSTLDGALELSGQGRWDAQGLHFQGEAKASADRVDTLSNLLNIIGRRDGARSLIQVN
jgi:general secretion pathway protein N